MIEGGPRRLHEGWRHGGRSATFNLPFDSPAYVRRWLEEERSLAAEELRNRQQHPSYPTKRATKAGTNSERLRVSGERPPDNPPAPTPSPTIPLAMVKAPPLAGLAERIASANRSKLRSDVMRNLAQTVAQRNPADADLDSEFLTIDELLARWKGVSRGTLANMRADRRGPSFTVIARNILYYRASVLACETQASVACQFANRLDVISRDNDAV